MSPEISLEYIVRLAIALTPAILIFKAVFWWLDKLEKEETRRIVELIHQDFRESERKAREEQKREAREKRRIEAAERRQLEKKPPRGLILPRREPPIKPDHDIKLRIKEPDVCAAGHINPRHCDICRRCLECVGEWGGGYCGDCWVPYY